MLNRKTIPTVIMDVERGSSNGYQSENVFERVRSLAKSLATCCRGVIVLFEANAKRFIFVDEMTPEEAELLLKALDFRGSDADMKQVCSNPDLTFSAM